MVISDLLCPGQAGLDDPGRHQMSAAVKSWRLSNANRMTTMPEFYGYSAGSNQVHSSSLYMKPVNLNSTKASATAGISGNALR